ncbi:MAG: BMP family ABC transporter substrate-binding protein [Candidatus Heteroscillospira sp.]|jgi:basic membrane protein A
MKRTLALLLALVMLLGMTACGGDEKAPESTAPESNAPESTAPEAETKDITVGIICIGDENDQGYTYNFMRGVEDVTEKLAGEGINVTWIPKYNILENSDVEDACIELAEEGCSIVICNSYGHEPFMLKVAPDYEDVQFISCTNLNSTFDDLENTHNAFANIYEGRYAAGVVAGMKLQELIDSGEITAEEAIIGYVGAYAYAEVISGFTAFYLGARSVCPSVTMKVQYVSSWSDPTAEANAAQALIDEGAVLISQHSDNTTPATTAQQNGVYHCGYNNDMISVAPDASLISCRIDWSVYFEYAIKAVVNGEEFDQDWTAGMPEGAVLLTELNETIAAPGTAEKLEAINAGLTDGSIHVFAGPWTGTGTAYGASAPDTKTVAEGEWFQESDVANGQTSAPYFYWLIDGITELNSGF